MVLGSIRKPVVLSISSYGQDYGGNLEGRGTFGGNPNFMNRLPKKKKGLPWLLIVIICLVLLVVAFLVGYSSGDRGSTLSEIKTLKVTNYINDYANLVSDGTEEYLNSLGQELEDATGSQVVFITLDSLNGADIREVAYKTFNYYKLGDSEKNNGILFIVSIQDKLRYMEVGVGLEDVITDISSQHLQKDYLVPDFQKGNYEEGLRKLYIAVTETIKGGEVSVNPSTEDVKDSYLYLYFVIAIILLGLAIIADGGGVGGTSGGGSGGSSGGGGFSGGGGSSGGGGAGGSW